MWVRENRLQRGKMNLTEGLIPPRRSSSDIRLTEWWSRQNKAKSCCWAILDLLKDAIDRLTDSDLWTNLFGSTGPTCMETWWGRGKNTKGFRGVEQCLLRRNQQARKPGEAFEVPTWEECIVFVTQRNACQMKARRRREVGKDDRWTGRRSHWRPSELCTHVDVKQISKLALLLATVQASHQR